MSLAHCYAGSQQNGNKHDRHYVNQAAHFPRLDINHLIPLLIQIDLSNNTNSLFTLSCDHLYYSIKDLFQSGLELRLLYVDLVPSDLMIEILVVIHNEGYPNLWLRNT